MNKKQRSILKKRLKKLKADYKISWKVSLFLLIILFGMVVLCSEIGLFTTIFLGIMCIILLILLHPNRIKKQLEEIEFRLAGK